jgi:hypothetical protein
MLCSILWHQALQQKLSQSNQYYRRKDGKDRRNRWISVNEPATMPMAAPTEFLILPLYRRLVSAGKA